MPMTSPSDRFIKISHVQGKDILFVGNPYELLVHGKVCHLQICNVLVYCNCREHKMKTNNNMNQASNNLPRHKIKFILLILEPRRNIGIGSLI